MKCYVNSELVLALNALVSSYQTVPLNSIAQLNVERVGIEKLLGVIKPDSSVSVQAAKTKAML